MTAKVTGIGGVLFRADDPEALSAWYRDVLGIDDFRQAIWQADGGPTVFAPFARDTGYFGSETRASRSSCGSRPAHRIPMNPRIFRSERRYAVVFL